MMFTALSPHCPCCYLQDHPQQSHGVTDDQPFREKLWMKRGPLLDGECLSIDGVVYGWALQGECVGRE